eukprot:scaffold18186_cov37-Prasinocladus_malaysianus.AAC.3
MTSKDGHFVLAGRAEPAGPAHQREQGAAAGARGLTDDQGGDGPAAADDAAELSRAQNGAQGPHHRDRQGLEAPRAGRQIATACNLEKKPCITPVLLGH